MTDSATSPGQQPRVCLTTYFDRNFAAIGALNVASLERYAAAHGHRVVLHNEISSSRPPAWNKILVLQKILAEEVCDFVFWVDSDALFVRYDLDILSEVEPGKELYLVKHRNAGHEVPNTGVVLLRNSAWTREFLDKVWASERYIYHAWWENAAIMDLLGYTETLKTDRGAMLAMRLLTRTNMLARFIAWRSTMRRMLARFRRPITHPLSAAADVVVDAGTASAAKPYAAQVKWMDEAWNSLPDTNPIPTAVIHHYPAQPLEARLRKMHRDSALSLLDRTSGDV